MQVIPITDVPSQTLQVQLGGQPCSLNIYQKSTGLFMDVLISDQPVISGVLCQNLNRIIRNSYLGFIGDILFEDLQGSLDPFYGGGLGTRFILCYLQLTDTWGVQ